MSTALVAALVDLAVARGDAGPYQLTPPVIIAFNLYQVTVIGFALRAWRHPRLDRSSRRAWGVMVFAFVLLCVSGALRSRYPSGIGFPSPADVLRLSAVPVMLVGLLTLPRRSQGRRERHKMWLDTAVVVIASGMLLWYLEIGPSVARAGTIPGERLAAAIAYPALDLVLIFGAAVVLFRGAAASARWPATLLGLGVLMLVAGDVYLGYQQSNGGVATQARWQFACWLTGHFLFTMAAFEQCRLARRHRMESEETSARAASSLPYLAVGLGYGLLVLAVWDLSVRILGLAAGAVAMTGVVIVRQVVALRENHELAITDTLTGLVNRRELHDRLRLALARGARNGQGVAALVWDLNDFKQVNDTMGHKAGDRLLVAFGWILRRNVLGLDVVGRLGGDEFAVVLHDIDSTDDAMAVARRIITDLQQPLLIGDTPVQPQAAVGVALSAPGQLDVDELLHRADLAMYRAKAAGRTCAELYREPLDTPAPGAG